tara:strand:+ start:242 stop:718 length:477 start_codon:yes stop_codon:yes gene_type:complete
MDKFDVHKWHYDKRISENDDPNWQKRQDRLTPGKNPDEFYGDDFKKLQQKYGEPDDLQYVGDPSHTELNDDEKDFVGDILEEIYEKINPTHDIKKYTGLFKYVEAWFEDKGGIGSMDEQNITGGDVAFNSGDSPAYATPSAFASSKSRWKRKNEKYAE